MPVSLSAAFLRSRSSNSSGNASLENLFKKPNDANVNSSKIKTIAKNSNIHNNEIKTSKMPSDHELSSTAVKNENRSSKKSSNNSINSVGNMSENTALKVVSSGHIAGLPNASATKASVFRQSASAMNSLLELFRSTSFQGRRENQSIELASSGNVYVTAESSLASLKLTGATGSAPSLNNCTIPLSSAQRRSMIRQYIVDEILTTEINYKRSLEILLNKIQGQMKQSISTSKPIMPAIDIKIVFSYIPELLYLSEKLVTQLQLTVHNWNPVCSHIGEIFLSFTQEWNYFRKYVDNYGAATQAIKRSEDNPTFKAFVHQCQLDKECQRQSLTDFMIIPIQRVPRYVLLLEDLKKHTATDHADYANICYALDSMKVLAAAVNEGKRREEEMTRLFTIQSEIDQCPPTIIAAHRRLVMECSAIQTNYQQSSEKNIKIYVFSDILLIAKILKGGGKFKCRFVKMWQLQQITYSEQVLKGGKSWLIKIYSQGGNRRASKEAIVDKMAMKKNMPILIGGGSSAAVIESVAYLKFEDMKMKADFLSAIEKHQNTIITT